MAIPENQAAEAVTAQRQREPLMDGCHVLRCTNPLVSPLQTDMYEVTMAYAYWKAGRAEEQAVFDLLFRKNPFQGEFTVFAGLSEALALVASFAFTDADVQYLQSVLPECDAAFFEWLRQTDCSAVRVYAQQEGSVVFPRVPLLRVEGPLAVAQLLEAPLLNLINYPSLIATNAARYRLAVGGARTLVEFGLRRAQGPDGGLSASRYSFIGGFDATSNLLAGRIFGLPVRGTHAHAFVQSYRGVEDVRNRQVGGRDLVALACAHRTRLKYEGANEGEFAAFCAYAAAFPNDFLALCDTYDTLQSGVPNFIAVALALDDCGHRARGVRLDSGDLAYLSRETRAAFAAVAAAEGRPWLAAATIMASSDINESVLRSLSEQGHAIDVFGVGTHLVTCQAQPALGGVYKLVQIGDEPRIKLSDNVTLPGRKCAYRLFGTDGCPLVDLLQGADAPPPLAGRPVLCKHPFEAARRALVTPSRVQPLHTLVWDGRCGGLTAPLPGTNLVRDRALQVRRGMEAALQGLGVASLREDMTRALNPTPYMDVDTSGVASLREDMKRALNPTPYKVSLSTGLFTFMHELWEREAPIKALS